MYDFILYNLISSNTDDVSDEDDEKKDEDDTHSHWSIFIHAPWVNERVSEWVGGWVFESVIE